MKNLFLLLIFVSIIHADNEDKCVQLGYAKAYDWDKEESQYIQNTCDYDVYIFWCHDKNEKGYTNGLCGKKETFYVQASTFTPEEKKFNSYTIPTDTIIHHGACRTAPKLNGARSVKKFNPGGSYICTLDSAQEISSDNKLNIPCSGYNKSYVIMNKPDLHPDILKLKDPDSNLEISIHMKNLNGSEINTRLCKEAGTVNDPTLLNKIKNEIRKKYQNQKKSLSTGGIRG